MKLVVNPEEALRMADSPEMSGLLKYADPARINGYGLVSPLWPFELIQLGLYLDRNEVSLEIEVQA